MLPLKMIREDLREIRYYYSRKKVFDTAVQGIAVNAVYQKVNKYNEIMKTAPPKLFDLYVSLYVNNYTQEGLAYELNYTPEYVQMLNKRLLLFLQSKID